MAIYQEEGRRMLPIEVVGQLVGRSVPSHLFNEVSVALDASKAREYDLVAQARELLLIKTIADDIEDSFAQREMSLPIVYALHTAGVPVPFEGEVIGKYAKPGLFKHFPPTDILGHEGQVTLARIDDNHTYMALEGRAHPYEWRYHPYGQIFVARPLNVIKELIRRQREKGENPIIITSYLSGVYEGHPLESGDVGIILDDMELGERSIFSAAAQGLLEKFLGSRFQLKAGRSSTGVLASTAYNIGKEQGVPIGPVMIVGTPSTPEFEGWGDTGAGLAAFDKAVEIGFADFVSGFCPDARPSLVFGMGNVAELAVMRRILDRENPDNVNDYLDEPDFPILALAIVTDSVGENGFATNHREVVRKALEKADRNAAFIRSIVTSLVAGQIELPPIPPLPDWALPYSLQQAFLPIESKR